MDNPGLLSQSEIDALLAAMASGEMAEAAETDAPQDIAGPEVSSKQHKRYDFRRPDRFSKEQMRALRMIHETWARRVSVSLSAYLRTSVEAQLSDIDQGMYTNLQQQLPERGVYYIIGLTPLAGHFMLHMNADLAMMTADRLMGGPGTALSDDRRLTDLEIELLRGVTEKMLIDLADAWSSAVSIHPRIDDISQNLLLVPIALPTDAMVWASFEVRIKGATSAMVLGLPYPALKPIANQLSPYTWIANPPTESQSGESSEQRRNVMGSLTRLKLPITAVLGSTSLTLEELVGLQPGDVLPLDIPIDEPCTVQISGRPKYHARLGVRRHKLAVQLEDLIGEPLTVGAILQARETEKI